MTLALSASSPAIVTGAPTDGVLTTASFTPPANSLIVVSVAMMTDFLEDPAPSPSITDSLGAHLTYTSIQRDGTPDGSGGDGQCAAWSAPGGGSAMTITVTNNSGNTDTRHTALCVQVFTDSSGSRPTIGASVKGNSTSPQISIAATYTATVTGSRGVLVYSDADNGPVGTAGTGCTLTGGGAGTVSSTLGYGFVLRTSADGTAASGTTLNVSLLTSAQLRWVALEVCPPTSTTAAEKGTTPLGIVATVADVKVAVESALGPLGIAATVAHVKVAVAGALCPVGLAGTAVASKVAAALGLSPLGVGATGAAMKAAVQAALTPLGLVAITAAAATPTASPNRPIVSTTQPRVIVSQ